MKTAVENILQVVLHAGGRLGGIVVEVVDVNVALAVRPPVAHPHQILIGVILGHLRGEGHHLPSRRMRRHVGVAQVHVVLLDSHDAVHHLLHRGAFLALLGAPLAIDDEALGHRRVAPHQMALDQILNLLDRNLALVDGGGHLAGNLFHRSFVVDTIGPIGLGNSPLDFGNRETLLGTIALGNGNACIIHVDKLFRVGYCERLRERPFASLSLRQVFWLFPIGQRLPDLQKQILVSGPSCPTFRRNHSSGTARDSHPIPFLSTPSYNGVEPECRCKVTQIRDNQTTNFEIKVFFFGKLLKIRIEKSFLKPATNRGPYQLPYGNYTAIKQQKRHLFHCSIGYPIESTKLLSIPAT